MVAEAILTDDQVAFYREQGYLLVPDVFSADEIAALNAVTDGFVEASRDVTASTPVFDVAPDHTAAIPKLRRIKHPTKQDPAYDAAMRHPKLLSILQQLIGEAIRFDHAKLNIKPIGGGGDIHWHQDWAFYPQTNDDMLAVGVFLGDVGEDSGPLQVIPGTHRGLTYNHHNEKLFCGAISDDDLGDLPDNAVTLTGKAGTITIHHVRMVHGSTANTSPAARRLLLYSYGAVDSWPLLPLMSYEEFEAQILTGEPTLVPRQIAVPIRLPLPRAQGDDSIYDNQSHQKRRA